MQQFMQTAANEFQEQHQQEIELAVATASILPGGDCYEHNGQVCLLKVCSILLLIFRFV